MLRAVDVGTFVSLASCPGAGLACRGSGGPASDPALRRHVGRCNALGSGRLLLQVHGALLLETLCLLVE